MRRARVILLVFAVATLARSAVAATQYFSPVADTSLLEVAPTNNLGGFVGMNSGTTQEGNRTRALLRFDLGSLPTNTVVLAASLLLEVTRQPDEPPNNSSFSLHRMLRPWGEGSKAPLVQFGKGLPASPGEATWLHAFYPTNVWTSPGGAPDVDFSSVSSSYQLIEGVGESPYLFDTTPELVADVQHWIAHPTENFGWMLQCDDEGTIFTARRFGAHEDPDVAPQLAITYIVPPIIDSVQRVGNDCTLSFVAQPGLIYTVEYCDALGTNAWQPLAYVWTPSDATRFVITDTTESPQRFYRIVIR